MSHDRLVPLIIAVALFMENMDSTIIATSLPAIAADIGANPLALKLAITSYLLSLAVFIPASGWTADRFGARTVFRAAIAIFVIGSIGCALANSLEGFVIARILQGMGGAMMTPVGRLVLVRSIDRHKLVDAMAWVTMPALIGPIIGPPVGGFITTYASWHWIFLINVPIGLIGIVLATNYIEDVRVDDLERFDLTRHGAGGRGRRGACLRAVGRGAGADPAVDRRGPDRGRGALHGGLCAARAAHACPGARFLAGAHPDVPRQCGRRLAVPPRHRRACLPAAADAAARLQLHAARIRADDLHGRGRRVHDEDLRGAHHPPLRLPPRADRQRAAWRAPSRRPAGRLRRQRRSP